jgi:hypothetical protein
VDLGISHGLLIDAEINRALLFRGFGDFPCGDACRGGDGEREREREREGAAGGASAAGRDKMETDLTEATSVE